MTNNKFKKMIRKAAMLMLAFAMVLPCVINAVFAEGSIMPTGIEPEGETDRVYYMDYVYKDYYADLRVNYSPADADTATRWSSTNTDLVSEPVAFYRNYKTVYTSSYEHQPGTATVTAISELNPELSVDFNVTLAAGDPPAGTFTAQCDIYPAEYVNYPNGASCIADRENPIGLDVDSVILEQGKAYQIALTCHSDLCAPSSTVLRDAVAATGLLESLPDLGISMWKDDVMYASVNILAANTGTGTIRIGNDKEIKVTVVNSGARWVKDNNGWWYDNGDGTYPKNTFKVIDGEQYYFDGRGYMVTGWYKCGGWYYFFENSGAMKKNAWEGEYWLKENGMMAVSEWVDGGRYYVNEYGRRTKTPHWEKDSNGWWYNYGDGSYPRAKFEKIGNERYYFDNSGYMVTGWQRIKDLWYYFGSSGAAVKGWQKLNGSWYYFNTSNQMVTGLKQLGNDKYYFNENGAMIIGWQRIGSDWYYFESSGAMKTSGWVGNYYLKYDGKMARSERVDGGKYYVDANGLWVPGA